MACNNGALKKEIYIALNGTFPAGPIKMYKWFFLLRRRSRIVVMFYIRAAVISLIHTMVWQNIIPASRFDSVKVVLEGYRRCSDSHDPS